MSREIQKLTKAKDRIIRFLVHEDIALTAEEDGILARWEFCDTQMRAGVVSTTELIEKITAKYRVSAFTAGKDISCSMEVFARSREVNKKYIGHLHLEDIATDLKKLREKMFSGKGGDKMEYDHKDIMALAKLHDAYTYQLNSLPDTLEAPVIKRPIFLFYSANGQQIPAPMQFDEAMAKADQYIDFETVKG